MHGLIKTVAGDVDTDWRSDLFKRDIDFFWIGQKFETKVNVKCISLYNGYNCGEH